MNNATFIPLKNIKITDSFWKEKIDLISNEVILYQWEMLNDNIQNAEKSYCMRNYKLAGEILQKRKSGIEIPVFDTEKWQYTPENSPENSFLGWVFQDSDFSKWIEAVGYSLFYKEDKELEKIADGAIDIVCNAQMENGYLNTFYEINNPKLAFTNLKDKHELYCFGHLAEGAISYHNATGKKKLLNAVIRYADLICNTFGEDKIKGYPGHEIAEMALVKLYELTKNENYLNTAKFFIDERGKKPYYFDKERGFDSKNNLNYQYNQAHLPVREQDEAVGHAVRGVYLYSGMADIARCKNDAELFLASKKLFDNIVQKKMYITGGIGANVDGESFSFDYDLPNDTAYAESCASIGLVFFAKRMLQIEQNSKYADVMEKCIYNSILSGIAEDGKSFFYTNPLVVNPKACKEDSRKRHIKPVRQKWFGCACCPPNIARLITSYPEYCFMEKENSVFINLYESAEFFSKMADFKISSAYLENGEVKIDVKTKKPFQLALRIPSWCNDFSFSVKNPFIKNGYAFFSIENDATLTANFSIKTKIIKCNNNVPENMGKVAITRGPFVYCLEEIDNGKNLHLLSLSHSPKFTFEDGAIFANGYREELDTSNKLYEEYKENRKKLTRLKFIPYYKWANRGENEMSVYIKY